MIPGTEWFKLWRTECHSDSWYIAGAGWTPSKLSCFLGFAEDKYRGLLTWEALPSGPASGQLTLPMWRIFQPACALTQRWKSWHCVMKCPHLRGCPDASPRLWCYELRKGRHRKVSFPTGFPLSWSLRWLYHDGFLNTFDPSRPWHPQNTRCKWHLIFARPGASHFPYSTSLDSNNHSNKLAFWYSFYMWAHWGSESLDDRQSPSCW